ncbi:MAG: hypothetical protein ACOX3C_02370 [Bacilli bacterium]|jgi:hypothetical protein
MNIIMKRKLGPLTLLLMALGVGLGVAKTPVGVKAATETAIIKKMTTTAYTNPIADGAVLQTGYQANSILIDTQSSASIVVTYHRNSATGHDIFNNTVREIKLYNGAPSQYTGGGEIRITLGGTYVFTKVTVNTSQNVGLSINGSLPATNQIVTRTLTNRSNVLSLKNVCDSLSGWIRITQISIEFDMDVSAKTLTGISYSGTLAKTNYSDGEYFDPTGLTFTATYDDYTSQNVTSSIVFNPSKLVEGMTSVGVSYTEAGVNKTTTITEITVGRNPNYYFTKVTSIDGLHFGANYIIGYYENTYAMGQAGSINFAGQTTTQGVSGTIKNSDNFTKIVLEVGVVVGTYAFKAVSTDANTNGKYLYAASSTNNELKLETTKTINSSWKITYSGGYTSIVAIGSSNRNVLRFSKTYSTFSCYTPSSESPVDLYLDADRVDHTLAATIVASEIMSGLGYEAQLECAERLPVLHEAINMLCTDARNIYDTSTETLFVNARARMAYMAAWVAAHAGSPQRYVETKASTIGSAIAIGIIGLSAMVGYYFISRRKKFV